MKQSEAEKAEAKKAKADEAAAKKAKAAKAKADKEAKAKAAKAAKGPAKKTYKVSLVKAKDYSYGHRKFLQGRPVFVDEKLALALKASGFFRVEESNPEKEKEEA